MKLLQTIDQTTNTPVYHGDIATWSFSTKFKLVPITTDNENAPHFEMVAKAPSGGVFQIGVAYKHKINHGKQAGQDMFQLKLECELEEVPSGSYVAFPNGTAIDQWIISVERPSKREQDTTDNGTYQSNGFEQDQETQDGFGG